MIDSLSGSYIGDNGEAGNKNYLNLRKPIFDEIRDIKSELYERSGSVLINRLCLMKSIFNL
jgi:hypothetical protein